jgi:hypothetical protein
MKNSFALVTEGPTDQEVITNIICGFYNNKDIDPSLLQPSRASKVNDQTPGGWGNLVNYLASQKFRDSFSVNEFVIIHFDADVCDDTSFGVTKTDDLAVMVESIVLRLCQSVGEDFYNSVRERIIFAICVDSIECWLLPLYFDGVPAKRNKQSGCISTLNPELTKKHGFYINEKVLQHYSLMSKPYLKRKTLLQCAEMNDSLKQFLLLLPDVTRIPSVNEED